MKYRLSRPCYDKPRRCPGWAGGGTKHAKVYRCKDGYLKTNQHLWKWRFHKCDECGVIVFPYMIRYLDPTYLPWVIDTWKYKWQERRDEKEWREKQNELGPH